MLLIKYVQSNLESIMTIQENASPISNETLNSESFRESAELGTLLPKGDNSYILGSAGSGKTIYMTGVIANNLSKTCRYSTKYKNIVVLDAGRSYEGLCTIIPDSQFVYLKAINHTALVPIDLSGKKLTVFDFEEIRHSQTDAIANQLINLLKNCTTQESLVIIDEWWLMHQAIKRWSLTEFEGETLVSAITEKDITQDNAYHLFQHGMELSGVKTRRVNRCTPNLLRR